MATDSTNPSIINMPSDFHYGPVEFTKPKNVPLSDQQPIFIPPKTGPLPLPVPLPFHAPLGILSRFTGTFAGKGFNSIFRPNNAGPNATTFPGPVSGHPIPQPPNENVLELNLTTEKLSFSTPLGNVPNRGLGNQEDIELNGVPYVQVINDVTNVVTGKADGTPTGIHFEPGLWMHVPATKVDPVEGESLVRMASIPHGTVINAQTVGPTTTIAGPPDHPPVDMTPFVINTNTKVPFVAQKANLKDTPRLPQDLTPFIAAGTITQEILENPNLVLKKAIAGQNITSTTFFTVSTLAKAPVIGGGTANIAFLEGTGGGVEGNSSAPLANADAVTMTATFWIETVEHTLLIPIFKLGDAPLHLSPLVHTPILHPVPVPGPDPAPINTPITSPIAHPATGITSTINTQVEAAATSQLAPKFIVEPPHPITVPTTIRVHTTQIQYSQTVNLNFARLTWPHISVATLVPCAPLTVPASVWG